jgi:hypothetical protein
VADGCGGKCESCALGDVCAGQTCQVSSETVIYVVPPVRDTKILPDTSLQDGLRSFGLSLVAAPGEYEPTTRW